MVRYSHHSIGNNPSLLDAQMQPQQPQQPTPAGCLRVEQSVDPQRIQMATTRSPADPSAVGAFGDPPKRS